MNDLTLASIEQAIDVFKQGRMVIIVDDEDRENEGDLVIAADHADTAAINFMATHGRGLICLAMRAALLDRLQIPMMVPQAENRSGFGTGFTISVEAANGVSTGISAADRAHTIQTLINPRTRIADIAMPGHIFPLRARDGGVLERRGQTEASVDLAQLSDLTPAGVICEVMQADGSMMRLPELLKFGQQHDIPVISVESLAEHRLATQPDATDVVAKSETTRNTGDVVRVAETRLPTPHGEFRMSVYRDAEGIEHSALVMGELASSAQPPIVRVHSECLTGDAFGSLRCDCGEQLQTAMATVAAAGTGIVLYLRQEGRGIGLGNKIRAYALQDAGLDTVDANYRLGFPADARHYGVAAAILRQLGTSSIRLLSNNPDKATALADLGIDINETLPLIVDSHEHNKDYLATKAQRMGHALPDSAAKRTLN